VILQRWRDGDRRAGEELCARHFDEVYRFFAHKLANDADDLTQQTFLACVKARNQFLGQSTFRTYLFSIARNQLYTRLRKLPKAEHVDLEVSSLNELVSSPSHKLREHQEVAEVRAAMGQLPVDQQVLLELHYWHDLDATALATSPARDRSGSACFARAAPCAGCWAARPWQLAVRTACRPRCASPRPIRTTASDPRTGSA